MFLNLFVCIYNMIWRILVINSRKIGLLLFITGQTSDFRFQMCPWNVFFHHCPSNWPLHRNKSNIWRGIIFCFSVFANVNKWLLQRWLSTRSLSQNQSLPALSDRNYQSVGLGGQLFTQQRVLNCSAYDSKTAPSVSFLKMLNLNGSCGKYRARAKVRPGTTCYGSAVDLSIITHGGWWGELRRASSQITHPIGREHRREARVYTVGPEEVSSPSLSHRRAGDWRSDTSLKHSNASHSHPSGHLMWFSNTGTCSTCEGQYWEKIRWSQCPVMLWPALCNFITEYYRSTRGKSEVETEILRWEKLSIPSFCSSFTTHFWLQISGTAKCRLLFLQMKFMSETTWRPWIKSCWWTTVRRRPNACKRKLVLTATWSKRDPFTPGRVKAPPGSVSERGRYRQLVFTERSDLPRQLLPLAQGHRRLCLRALHHFSSIWYSTNSHSKFSGSHQNE